MRRVLLITLSLLLYINIAFPSIINVPTSYATIQAGIDASQNGDTVLVQPGTYIENINFNGKNIVLASLYLTTNNSNYINSTIIDGDSSGSVITLFNGEDSTTAIIGFTIQNGAHIFGGGFNCTNNTKATIAHNKIIHNYATHAGTNTAGGGIYLSHADVQIIDNDIDSNYSLVNGGGIYCEYSNPNIINNDIYDNSIDTIYGLNGGGIMNKDGSPKIINNNISFNRALNRGYGGGIFTNIYGRPIIEDNTISNNFALYAGGISTGDSAIILNNIISDNESIEAAGGIDCHRCKGEIAFNTISNNKTDIQGGGIEIHEMCFPSFHHNLVSENIVFGNFILGKGAGLSILSCFPEVYNNTIINNKVINGSSAGIFYFADHNIFFNNIIRGNSATTYDQVFDYLDSLDLRYNNIEGSWPGIGNIDCDPRFCNPAAGDYRIADFSCCAGAGCDSLGNPNPQYNIGAFDIGCYVDSCSYMPGDVNSDGLVIASDVTFLINYLRGLDQIPRDICYDQTTGLWLYVAADANGDCRVIGSDVTFMINYLRGLQPSIRWCPNMPPLEP